MSEITEPQKKVIRKLRRKLKGKCGNACPRDIEILHLGEWFNPWECEDCAKHFLWLNKDRSDGYCPCDGIPYETIYLRFSELLDEEI